MAHKNWAEEQVEMERGLDITFAVLRKTSNEAAVRVLLSALDAPDRSIQERALRTLLARRSPFGQREILRRWHTLSERWKGLVAEHPLKFVNASREALLSTEEQYQRNACDAVLRMRAYDLLPTLIVVAEDQARPGADLAASTLLLLAEMLADELAAPRDYRNRRDPHLVLPTTLRALENSSQRYDQHERSAILEALLMLAKPATPWLVGILQHVHDKTHVAVMQLLLHSPRKSVMRLLLQFLGDGRISAAALHVLTHRKDVSFVRYIAKRMAGEIPDPIRRNLKRIDSMAWLAEDLSLLLALNGEEQCGAIHLALESGMNRTRVFAVIRFVLMRGAVEGRRAAAEALPQFRGVEANELIVQALRDEDTEVQALAVPQLRERGISGAVATLVELLDSPHEMVCRAAREALSEFSFARYLATFESLDEVERVRQGGLVKRVDLQTVFNLHDELQSDSRVRRVRGVRMAVAMNAVSDVEESVRQLLFDADHCLRATATEALACSDTSTSREALHGALQDRSYLVREAAELALKRLAESHTSGWGTALSVPPDDGLSAVLNSPESCA